MKYLIEVEKLLKDLFFENWMDEEDWKEFLIELEKTKKICFLKNIHNFVT